MGDISVDSVGLNNLTEQIAAFGFFIAVLATIIGIVMVIYGLYSMTDYAQKRGGGTIGSPVSMITIGSMLIAMFVMINIGTATIFGTDGGHELRTEILAGEGYSEAQSQDTPELAAAINFGFTVIALVGLAGFIRGWLLLNNVAKNGSQPGASIGHAAVLIVGGILALNIHSTVLLLAGAVGTVIALPWLDQVVNVITGS